MKKNNKNSNRRLTIYDYNGTILDIYKGDEFVVINNGNGDILVKENNEEVIYSKLPYILREEGECKND